MISPRPLVVASLAGTIETLFTGWELVGLSSALLVAFFAFRFFDIVKPWPVSLANRPGALPLMLDDIVAGVIAGALMLLAAAVAHGWF